MEQIEKGDQQKEQALDYINALATYKAREAGVFGREEIKAEIVGVYGAAMTDVAKTSLRFLSGESTKEEAKEEIKQTAETAARTMIQKFAEVAVDGVAAFIKSRLPILSVVINVAKEFVKKTVIGKVVDKVVEGGKKLLNAAKEKFKRLFQ